jgi:hypothetical protein
VRRTSNACFKRVDWRGGTRFTRLADGRRSSGLERTAPCAAPRASSRTLACANRRDYTPPWIAPEGRVTRGDGPTTAGRRIVSSLFVTCALVVVSHRASVRAGEKPVSEQAQQAPQDPASSKLPRSNLAAKPKGPTGKPKQPSGRSAEAASAPQPPPPRLTLTPLWEGRSIEVGKLDRAAQQIAVRGALAVVPVSGEANAENPGRAALLVIARARRSARCSMVTTPCSGR